MNLHFVEVRKNEVRLLMSNWCDMGKSVKGRPSRVNKNARVSKPVSYIPIPLKTQVGLTGMQVAYQGQQREQHEEGHELHQRSSIHQPHRDTQK